MQLPPSSRLPPLTEAAALPGPGRPTPFGADPGWLRPSPRLRRMRRAQTLAGVVVCLLVGCGLAAATASVVVVFVVAMGVILLGAAIWGFLDRRCASWGYVEREQDLLVRRGVMFRRLSVVPYGRMQSVEVTAGPVERSFGLSSVRLHTASAATDARIPGLAGPDATGLRDRLATLGEANAEGL